MVITKYTEDFVRLCVEKFFKENDTKFAELSRKVKFAADVQLTQEDEEFLIEKFEIVEESVIKILFRIEHCEDYSHEPYKQLHESHIIANIIDNTIGSNYCKVRPSDEQIHQIVINHNVIE